MKTRLLKKCRKGVRIILVRGSYQMDKYNPQTRRWEYYSGGARHNVLRDLHGYMRWSQAYKNAVAYKRIDDYYEKERNIIQVC
jgi:hypothetical protein